MSGRARGNARRAGAEGPPPPKAEQHTTAQHSKLGGTARAAEARARRAPREHPGALGAAAGCASAQDGGRAPRSCCFRFGGAPHRSSTACWCGGVGWQWAKLSHRRSRVPERPIMDPKNPGLVLAFFAAFTSSSSPTETGCAMVGVRPDARRGGRKQGPPYECSLTNRATPLRMDGVEACPNSGCAAVSRCSASRHTWH